MPRLSKPARGAHRAGPAGAFLAPLPPPSLLCPAPASLPRAGCVPFPLESLPAGLLLVGSLPPHCTLCPPVRLWSLTLMQPLPLTYLSPLRGYKLLRTKATPVLLSSQASASPQHLPRGCCSEAFLNEWEQEDGEGAGRGRSRRWSRKASRPRPGPGGREVQAGAGWGGAGSRGSWKGLGLSGCFRGYLKHQHPPPTPPSKPTSGGQVRTAGRGLQPVKKGGLGGGSPGGLLVSTLS